MNIKTITSTDGVNEVDFGSGASRFYWFRNVGATAVHVSGKADIVAGADGVAELAAGDSVCIETLGGKVYVLGEGKVQIHNTGDKFCPFKIAPAQSGGEAVDAYTKTESDARYALTENTVPRGLGFGYGTCGTAAATAVKLAALFGTNTPNFVNRDGGIVTIKFVYSVPANAVLNVNSCGAYPIFYRGAKITDGVISAGNVATFIFSNSAYHIVAVENGGNADTLNGKHASEFAMSLTNLQFGSNRIELPDGVNVGEWLVENAKSGNLYFIASKGSRTNLPNVSADWMWFSYDGNRYFARAWTADNGTTEFVLNNVNVVGGWKEISTTPIKSTPFSGTTNEYGNVVFTAVGNKIPVFAECSPYCGTPLRFNDNYWIHCINPITANNSIVANTAVTGTVYYVEM